MKNITKHWRFGQFVIGYEANIKVNKSLYQDIERHENSKTHEETISTAIRFKLNNDIENVINQNVTKKTI